MSRFAFLIALVALVLGGCRNPGSAQAQRARAQWHDPYPTTDMGPGLEGTRPPGFDKPFAEPLRDKLEAYSYGRSQAPP